MDYVTEMQLRNQFRNLEAALERNDRVAAMLATDAINRLTGKVALSPKEKSLTAGLPNWVNQLIEDRGVRLKAVENALNLHRVVLSPTSGKSGYGLKLECRF